MRTVRPFLLATLVLPQVAFAIPITAYDLLLPGQPATAPQHDVADAGDLDVDGLNDLMLGDPLDGPAGGVSIRYGGPPPFAGLMPPVRLLGAAPGDRFGWSVDGVGDLNCDGFDDIAVGAPGFLGNGGVFVWFGPIAPGVYPAGTANLILIGEVPGDQAGFSVQLLPDMDFDTCAELAIGAPGHDPAALIDAGAAYVVFSSSGYAGMVPLGVPTTMKYSGDVAGERLGHAVDTAGDFDANGFQDLFLGAPGFPAAGAAMVALTPFRYWSAGLSGSPITPLATTLVGELPGDAAGFSIDGGTDVDLDGRDDLLVGAPRHSGPATAFQGGAAYVVSGLVTPAGLGVVLPIQPFSEKWLGWFQAGQFGHDVSFIGDVTMDGFPEWAASAPFEAVGGGVGRVYPEVTPGPLLPGGFFLAPSGPTITAVPGFMAVGFAIDGGRNSDFDPRPDPIVGFYYQPLARNGLVTF